MTTTIQCANARFFNREAASDIEGLLWNLDRYTLDRTFEAFGNFIDHNPVTAAGARIYPEGVVMFWGNFADVSCVFHVATDDPALIERLTAAIRANQARDAYLDQPPYFSGHKLQIVEHKFSETQGEVELIYDGRRLGQYGETYTIQGGYWRGRGVRHWVDAARSILAREHGAKREEEKRAAA